MNYLTVVLFAGIAALPALVWLIFFLKEDVHPEPRKLIIYSFFIGALATIPALLFQILARNLTGDNPSLSSFIIFALIEETFKFLAAFYAVSKNKFFDEPIDAMIYMIVIASGFATVENILITASSLGSISSLVVYGALNVLLLRFVGATLLHVLSSGIIGYAWAKSLANETHRGPVFGAIIIATLIHAAFNYIVAAAPQNNLFYSSSILIAAAFFVLNDFEILKKKN